ncbi:IncF plasmid conjugative transfer pilus assembly protein TraK [Vibrio chagasii]|nr:IncF plasmid conjugative transfer pilus assembly protein TraK [Vibrio chagasii]CAH7077544.1 IncF plasmid conjugative transfer pilus assembly protein TraK [Vibrio chagasii]CAH7131125.1 IncF plasmid conjugative transfer pilus assembly protein TraK [Vibrio chagasii]
MRAFFTIVSLLVALLSPTALADNVAKRQFNFTDGDTISVTLSSLNINRLLVKGDKIVNVTCPSGFCTSSANQKDKTGSVSLKINIQLPFNAHITTSKGRIFSLFVNPKATPSVVTEFVPSDVAQEQPSVFDRGFDYPSSLAEFTKKMMHYQRDSTPISGFTLHQVDPKTLPSPKGTLPLVPQVVFVGEDYSGIIYEVKNQSNNNVTLTTAQFYSYAARSAALDRLTLGPNESTHLYLVTGGGVSDVR